jgi:Fe-S oxidoreductase
MKERRILMKRELTTDISKCIHCHKCRDNCAFLSKYGLDIGDAAELSSLAMHCFLAGKCTEVCPAGIDGREVMLQMKRERVAEGSADLSPYRMLFAEKRDYIFKNYRHAEAETVLFPGCNFPSMYPKTMKALCRLLKDKAGIGVAYDCCGQPLAELGLKEDEERIVSGINHRFREHGIKEAVVLCPNCYYFLRDRLDVKVTTIYEKLAELGIGGSVDASAKVFVPCPDRVDRELLGQIQQGFASGPLEVYEEAGCCGLGGNAGPYEPELAKSMTDVIPRGEKVSVYCASCAGKLARDGIENVSHVLTQILGTGERPDTGKSFINRALTKFK